MSFQTKTKSVKIPQIIVFNLKDYVFSHVQKELLKIWRIKKHPPTPLLHKVHLSDKYSAPMAAGRLNFAISLNMLPLAFRHTAKLFEN